jgi:hypothetical protein
MRAEYEPVHRLISACTMEHHDGLTGDERRELRRGLTDLEERAAGHAGLDRRQAVIQLAGDSNITRWGAGTDVLKLVVDYPRELSAELARVNEAVAARNRIWLHLAIVAGLSESTPHGLVGDAPIAAGRLADAGQWRNVPSPTHTSPTHPSPLHRCPVVVILDARLYQDMVKQRRRGFDPDEYVRVVSWEGKGSERAAWITAPGCDRASVAGPQADRRGRTAKRGISTPVKVALIGAAGMVAAAALPLALLPSGRDLILHGSSPAASPSPPHASPDPGTIPGHDYSYGPGPPAAPDWGASHIWSAHGGRWQWDWGVTQRGGPNPTVAPSPVATVPVPQQTPTSTPTIQPASPPVPTRSIDPAPSATTTTTTTTNLPTGQSPQRGRLVLRPPAGCGHSAWPPAMAVRARVMLAAVRAGATPGRMAARSRPPAVLSTAIMKVELAHGAGHGSGHGSGVSPGRALCPPD